MTRLEFTDCPQCQGTGIIETHHGIAGNEWSGYYPNITESHCEACEGQGEHWTTIQPADDMNEVYAHLDEHLAAEYWTLRMAA